MTFIVWTVGCRKNALLLYKRTEKSGGACFGASTTTERGHEPSNHCVGVEERLASGRLNVLAKTFKSN